MYQRHSLSKGYFSTGVCRSRERTMGGILLTSILLSYVLTTTSYEIAFSEDYSCENTICNPRAGDLLIGRESSLIASSTCGLNEVEAYCVVTTSGKSYCKECTSKQPYNSITNPESHRVENVVSRVPSNPGRWWQSQNAVHNVSIVLNLDTQFQFISTILRFKTYRPAAMYLERSYDFGRTWARYAYFSNNCKRDFPSVPEGPRRSLTDVTCTGVYSQLTPSEGGVVAYMAAPSEMHQSWPQYSKERDMRVDDSPLTRRKYYYALYEWNVWGRCTCFGHALRCKPKSSAEIIKPEKVYGVCECTHNTAGENCETCADFHWNKPWMPATRDAANACEKCNCNNHATACFFNPVLFSKSGNVSGGNCHGCMHNTEGVNCEFCQPNFYRHPSYPIDHPLTCQPCNCHLDGTLYDNFCQQYTIPEQNTIAGRCICKKNVGGEKCDRCKVGFWNFQAENPDGCEACSCNMIGTIDNGGCDPFTGLCTCKRFVGGPNCDRCLEGYFNLSTTPLGCQECACSQIGSLNPNCERVSGQCACKVGFTGRDCSEVENGYYIVPPHEVIDKPDEKEITLVGPKGEGKYVIVLDVDPKQIILIPTDDSDLARRCEVYREIAMEILAGRREDRTGLPPECEVYFRLPRLSWKESSSVAQRCLCNSTGSRSEICDKLTGQCPCKDGVVGRQCDRCASYHYGFSARGCTDCACDPQGSVSLQCHEDTSLCECRPGIVGKHCNMCNPGFWDFPNCRPCICNEFSDFCNQCKDGFWGDATRQMCQPCNCYPLGSIDEGAGGCNRENGQCSCLPNVIGPRCYECAPYFFNLTSGKGCEPCLCDPTGSIDDLCDPVMGQCRCKPDRSGRRCDQCRRLFYSDPTTPDGCQPCNCDRIGSTSDLCDPLTGQCPCRTGITGQRCDRCDRGTEGILPDCVPCGECWNNWDKAIDKVINRLQNQTGQQLPKELKIMFDSLVSLLDQIEHLPWMTTDDTRLNEFRDVLKRSEEIVMRLSSLDQFADSLVKWDDLITERFAQQLERKAVVNEAKARAYLSILRSKDIGDRAMNTQISIEHQRGGLEGDLSNSKRELEAVQTRADQLNSDWAQLDRRIEEFREKIRQTNRLICGDNSLPPTEDTDQKVCPSTCGGAGCDYFFSKSSNLNTISTTKNILMNHLNTGLISTCGVNIGCNASNAGRLRSRMEDYLNLQIRLTNALYNVYRAENAISKIQLANLGFFLYTSLITNLTIQAITLEERIADMYNLTTNLINEAEKHVNLYSSMSQEKFDEILRTLQNAKLNVSLYEAEQIIQQLEKYAIDLEDKVKRILAETELDRQRTGNLLRRAETIRDKAKDFMEQINQLKEADKIYQGIEEKPIIQKVDDIELFNQITQLTEQIDGFKNQVIMFSRDSSLQSDKVKEASEIADDLLSSTNVARRETLDTLQQIELVEVTFKQLDEKMLELDKLMRALDTGGRDTEDEGLPDTTLTDPAKLMEEIQNYTSILTNLKRLEIESEYLTDELKGYMDKMHKLNIHLSRTTKHHQLCT
ncbi:laminin, beta 1 [Schistosoma bovis]|uniref:Laminin, beta 1 n=1 Tax=Schistosoma bovis TaxID=6184 RepID=A0A430QKV2_SCHBO|nr:laminin, beta 1 [Schistosoma bovis]